MPAEPSAAKPAADIQMTIPPMQVHASSVTTRLSHMGHAASAPAPAPAGPDEEGDLQSDDACCSAPWGEAQLDMPSFFYYVELAKL